MPGPVEARAAAATLARRRHQPIHGAALALALTCIGLAATACAARSAGAPSTRRTTIAGTIAVSGQGPGGVAGSLPGTVPLPPVFAPRGAVADVLGSDGIVTMVDLASGRVTAKIPTGATPPQNPHALAVSADGTLAVVVDLAAPGTQPPGSLVPVDLVRHRAGSGIALPFPPVAVAIDPVTGNAWVTGAHGELLAVNPTIGVAGSPIQLVQSAGAYMDAIAITPDGANAVVLDDGGKDAGNLAFVVDLRARAVRYHVDLTGAPGAFLDDVAIAPGGDSAWIVNGGYGNGTITQLALSGGSLGATVPVGGGPLAIAIAPDASTAYVAEGGTGNGNLVVPVNIAPAAIAHADPATLAGTPFEVGQGTNSYLDALALLPDGSLLYAADREGSAIVPIRVATGLPGKAITVSNEPVALVLR